jgi:hypothetical protein
MKINIHDFLALDPTLLEIGVINFRSTIVLTLYEIQVKIPQMNLTYNIEKRYTEFQGLYDSLLIRYQKLQIPEFPSRYQIINKKEKRKQYFDTLLKTIHELACMHNSIRRDLLKLIYEFVFSKEGGVYKSIDDKDRDKDKDKDKESVSSRLNTSMEKSIINDDNVVILFNIVYEVELY